MLPVIALYRGGSPRIGSSAPRHHPEAPPSDPRPDALEVLGMKRLVTFVTVFISIPLGLGMTGQSWAAETMNVSKLEQIIHQSATQVKGGDNYWEFTVSGVRMACVADPGHDRMRIIAPIVRVSELKADQKDKMLEANFHSTIDARYAISNGVVYAAYIHPLSPLQDSEVESGLKQVMELVRTFGTTYSSGQLVFGRSNGK